MIDSDEDDRECRPNEQEKHPEAVLKRRSIRMYQRPVLLLLFGDEKSFRLTPSYVDQTARHHILNGDARIAARDADEQAEIVRDHGDTKGRHKSDKRQSDGEEAWVGHCRGVGHSRVTSTTQTGGEKVQALQIVAQSDADNGKAGADGEHGKERQVVVDDEHERTVVASASFVVVGQKVERVEVVEVGAEREQARVGQGQVEEHNWNVNGGHRRLVALFATHRRDYARQAVVTHERINACWGISCWKRTFIHILS